MDWSQSQTKVFHALLYCYPAEFRHEYGREMETLFADRLQREPCARLWFETLADLAVTAAAEHWHIFVFDVRYGARSLASVPAFTAIALFVIALGIGATVSVFSVVNAVLLRSLPYGHPEGLVYLWEPNHNFKGIPDELGPNIPDIYDWQSQNHSFSSIAIFHGYSVNLISGGTAHRTGAAMVTSNFFQTMEAPPPQLGRGLNAGDDLPGHDQVAVISDALWRGQFSGARDIIGRQIQINRQAYTVVGVMPKGFGYPFDGDVPYESYEFKQTDIWIPAAYSQALRTDRVNFRSANAIGRLRSGVSAAAGQAELMAIESHLQPLYPAMWRGWTVLARPLIETIVGPVKQMLWLLLGAVGLVLLIAISNLANLLLARATARSHELGIRTALGAERGRIIRQLLTESLLLSGTGGLLGSVLAYAAVRVMTAMNPGGIPRFESATVDVPVLAVAAVLAVATGLLAGALSAMAASRADVNQLLRKAGSRIAGGSQHGRFALIVVEVALSVVLLTGAGLLIRSYLQLAAVDPGFSPASLTFTVHLDDHYNRPELRQAFNKNFLEKLQGIPGVRYAGASSAAPLTNHESVTFAEIRGFGRSGEMVANYGVTTDYQKALGMALLRGRDFNAQDMQLNNSVMVNQRFAALYFAGRDPIGGQIRIGIGDLSKAKWLTVIGVTGDVRHMSLDEPGKAQIFLPDANGEDFAIASAVSPATIVSAARTALRSLDPALTLASVSTMGELMHVNMARRSFQTTLLTAFAGIAVALALTGLYGLMSYSVKQRTGEIGVRLAVGCSRTRILLLILGQGMRLTVAGLVCGLAGAFALTRLMRAWLFEITARDPVTILGVSILVVLISACACLLPAWNATRVNPIEALRQQ